MAKFLLNWFVENGCLVSIRTYSTNVAFIVIYKKGRCWRRLASGPIVKELEYIKQEINNE